MKIALLQLQSSRGDIEANITKHLRWVEKVAELGAEFVVFPELSLTNYEPTLASALASTPTDTRFEVFQKASDSYKLTIAVGMPIRVDEGICIGLLIFAPHRRPQVYYKQYLHPDEYPFFVSKKSTTPLINKHITLAICYEISIPQHSAHVVGLGARVYVASVAKADEGVKIAHQTLSAIAKKYQITVLMANSIGPSDDFVGAGQSGIWNNEGKKIAFLNNTEEGILWVEV